MKTTNDNNTKALSIRLDNETFNMLRSISLWSGIITPTETIRACIKDIYESTTIRAKEELYKKGFALELESFNQTFEEYKSSIEELQNVVPYPIELTEDNYVPNQGDIYVSTFEKMLPIIDFLAVQNKSDFITEMIRIGEYLSAISLGNDISEFDDVIKNAVKTIVIKLKKENLATDESTAINNIHHITLLADTNREKIEFTIMQGTMA